MGVGWADAPRPDSARGYVPENLVLETKIAVSLGPSATRCFVNVPVRLRANPPATRFADKGWQWG